MWTPYLGILRGQYTVKFGLALTCRLQTDVMNFNAILLLYVPYTNNFCLLHLRKRVKVVRMRSVRPKYRI